MSNLAHPSVAPHEIKVWSSFKIRSVTGREISVSLLCCFGTENKNQSWYCIVQLICHMRDIAIICWYACDRFRIQFWFGLNLLCQFKNKRWWKLQKGKYKGGNRFALSENENGAQPNICSVNPTRRAINISALKSKNSDFIRNPNITVTGLLTFEPLALEHEAVSIANNIFRFRRRTDSEIPNHYSPISSGTG